MLDVMVWVVLLVVVMYLRQKKKKPEKVSVSSVGVQKEEEPDGEANHHAVEARTTGNWCWEIQPNLPINCTVGTVPGDDK